MLELLKENGHHVYCTEMGGKVPDGCVFEASLDWYGKHWWLKSLTGQILKGRGIRDEGNGNYFVTARAFEKICSEYPVRTEIFLD